MQYRISTEVKNINYKGENNYGEYYRNYEQMW